MASVWDMRKTACMAWETFTLRRLYRATWTEANLATQECRFLRAL